MSLSNRKDSTLSNGDSQVTEDVNSVEEEYNESEIMQLVSFTIDEVEYGIEILSVQDIHRVPVITRLPNTPRFVKGVFNYRGDVVPVVDARLRFGFDKGAITEFSRVLVIEADGKLVGILVDNVHQVVRIPESFIDPPESMIEGVSQEFVYGIGRLKDRLIVILNMTDLLLAQGSGDENVA
jgi:purine-binding chemotaxis protein CheW